MNTLIIFQKISSSPKKNHVKIFEIQTFKISSLAPKISSEIENFLPDYLAICNVSGCGGVRNRFIIINIKFTAPSNKTYNIGQIL